MPTRKLSNLPREGTKDRQKMDAMRRPGGATQIELQAIDAEGIPGSQGYGTYKNDCARYAEFLNLKCKIEGSGKTRRYSLV